jgi:hypothetical protein
LRTATLAARKNPSWRYNFEIGMGERKLNKKGQHNCWPLKIKKFVTHLTRLGCGAQAARADFHGDGPAIFKDCRLLQIGFPLTLGLLLRKADVVTGHRFLTTN